MTSESYLRGEARWAREQAAKARRAADELSDPKWVAGERKRRRQALVQARIHVEIAGDALAELADPVPLIQAENATAEQWERLAREYEARICQEQDQPMWEDA